MCALLFVKRALMGRGTHLQVDAKFEEVELGSSGHLVVQLLNNTDIAVVRQHILDFWLKAHHHSDAW